MRNRGPERLSYLLTVDTASEQGNWDLILSKLAFLGDEAQPAGRGPRPVALPPAFSPAVLLNHSTICAVIWRTAEGLS